MNYSHVRTLLETLHSDFQEVDFSEDDEQKIIYKLDELVWKISSYIKQYPDEDELYYLAGFIYYNYPLARGDSMVNSEKYLLKALELNPSNMLALFYAGCLYFDTNRFKKAYSYLSIITEDYFAKRHQVWRDLKVMELKLCARCYYTKFAPMEVDLFRDIHDSYMKQLEEDRPLPTELVKCISEYVCNNREMLKSIELSKFCLRFISELKLDDAFSAYVKQFKKIIGSL